MCVCVCVLPLFFGIICFHLSLPNREELKFKHATSKFNQSEIQNFDSSAMCVVYVFICKLDTKYPFWCRSTAHKQLILIEFECFKKVAATTISLQHNS